MSDLMDENVCHQYLVKTKILEKNIRNFPILDYNKILIKEIKYKEANSFILQYEWLQNIGSAKYFYGLFIDNYLAAVACYTDCVSPNAYRKLIGIETDKNIIQLNRGASAYWAPKWAPSKLIGNSIKSISKKRNAIAIIAYADLEAGEIGTIYQACNFIYIGKTDPGGAKYYIIEGIKYHPRKVHKLFGTREKSKIAIIDPHFITIDIKPKLRYIYLTGTKTENQKILNNLQPYIKEYPKRSK